MKLNGKSVVVTGASSGMGKAIVERFAKEGANIIAVARRKERLEALAESLKDEPGKVIPYVGDISKEETNVGAIDAAVEHFGRLDILINNAGVMDDMSPIGDVRNETLDLKPSRHQDWCSCSQIRSCRRNTLRSKSRH